MASPHAIRLSVLLFTRFPVAGKAKTRLIPALGPEGAAELQRRMTRVIAARAWAFTQSPPHRRLAIHHEGGTRAEFRQWLGQVDLVPQRSGDLGQRMLRGVLTETARGTDRFLLIGADCPRLDADVLEAAAAALDDVDVVFGPARDGGYYLLGLRRPEPGLFEGIPWSTGDVLARSIEKARSLGLTHRLLGELPDVDEPPDLPDAEAALAAARRVSVIVPVLNEAENLRRLLPRLAAGQPHEILVADGGSTDTTRSVAESFGARWLAAPRGRARQMNAAAARATGEYLLFLHADTDPPSDYARLVADTLDCVGTAAGAFRFALREPIPGGFLVERGVALRCALRQLPYGDQGLFLRRRLFQALGGFPDWPLLEDLELVRRLRRLGRIAVTDEAAPTSSRRWREAGLIRTFLRHQSILLAHAFGASPERLLALRQAKGVKRQSSR